MSFERGVRLGVDVGEVRVGIAKSDPDGLLATPIATFDRNSAAISLQELIVEFGAVRIYVGLPKSLNGAENSAAQKARDFVDELSKLKPLENEGDYDVYFIDERFTTVSAHQALSNAGVKHKAHREVIDQVAAVMILQAALDQERQRQAAAGTAWVS